MKIISSFFLLFISFGLVAIEPGDRVENFRLIDQKGNSHELFYFNDQKALVFLVQGNGCPIARNSFKTGTPPSTAGIFLFTNIFSN